MKRTLMAAAAVVLALSSGAAMAQPYGHDNDRDRGHYDNNRGPGADRGGDHMGGPGGYVRHDDWRKGHRMGHDDWQRGQRVDWRSHHLRHPPRGYEWRQVDGNFVLGAVATGLIASIIANSH